MPVRLLRLISLVFAASLLTSCALRSVTTPRTFDPANEPTPVPTTVSIESPTYTAQVGDIVREVGMNGIIVPVNQMDLNFGQAGEVAAIHVVTGAEVAAGDLLAELNTTAIEDELVLAHAALAVAQGQLSAAETALANARRRAEIAVEKIELTLASARLKAADPPTEDQSLQLQLLMLDLELAELTLSELEAGVDPALTAAVAEQQLRVDQLNAQLAGAQLFAPAAGTILRINARSEQSITPDDVAIILADVDNLLFQTQVRDEDLALLVLGMLGTAALTNRPGPEVGAELTTLPAAYGGTGTASDIVLFTLEDQDGAFAINDRVTVTLVVGERPGVVWLPPQAIREFRGRQFVVIEEGEGQRRVDIETGLATRERVEIIAGVAAGQIVVGE